MFEVRLTRRRSQRALRPPPRPASIRVCRGVPVHVVPRCVLGLPADAALVAVASRLGAHLFRSFARYASAVHRAPPPRTARAAAEALRALSAPPCLSVHVGQVNAFSITACGARLATSRLEVCEARDLLLLAHWGPSAWSTYAPDRHLGRLAAPAARALASAHACMLASDGGRWGDLVPPCLMPCICPATARR